MKRNIAIIVIVVALARCFYLVVQAMYCGDGLGGFTSGCLITSHPLIASFSVELAVIGLCALILL